MLQVANARYGWGIKWFDVTAVVNALLRYGDGVPVGNGLAGDPWPGTPKVLRCTMTDGTSVEYAEHETAFWPPIKVANLIYHIYPRTAGRETWQANVRLLRQYANWINGRRIICIVQGAGCDEVGEVLREFGDFQVDEIVVRLNSDEWEMATFPTALAKVASLKRDEAVFYAHAKGVSRAGDELKAATRWTKAMALFLFGNPQKVLARLERFATVGSFKLEHGAFHANWHFSGTFFAMRHDRLFTQPHWHNFLQHKYFIEFYPGTMFRSPEASNLCPVARPQHWLNAREWEAIEGQLSVAEAAWLSKEA